ncbi:MAG: hypothetical protein HY511_01345 [Actinobacteria bacterium]|nr:hypothetical protein [Actinomycetota bacterium]
MRYAIPALACAAFVAGALAAGAAAVTPVEAKALLRVASRLAALDVKRAVPVVSEQPASFRIRRVKALDRQYPMSAQSYDEELYRALGLASRNGALRRALGGTQAHVSLYDPVTRTAYVQAGNNRRDALLHELVHALQDQHFDLRRLALLTGRRDASLAAAAAVEGHATLVAGVLAEGHGGRSVLGHTAEHLREFLDLEASFATTTGLRFSAGLRNLGGNKAVFGSLRRFPETTEQIFHVDKFLARERALPIILPVSVGPLELAADDTFGELDVRALLAVFSVPRLDHVGEGWGGGRSALYRGAEGDATVLVALDWDTPHDAAQWEEAVQVYVNEAFDADRPGFPEPVPCAATTCWQIGGRAIAFRRDGGRTALALGGTRAEVEAVALAVVPAA